MRLRLIDGHCPWPYAPGDLLTRAMGGTEASVLHLAEGLAARGVEVIVHQHNRTAVARHGATYAPPGDPGAVADADPQARVIVVNAAKIALLWARRQPCARVLLWRHNFVGARTAALGPALSQAGVRIVCVSCFHADHTAGRMRAKHAALPAIGVIANPVVTYDPGSVAVDPDRLIFASSPHKRLADCLARFQAVRRIVPGLRLSVCNPGYKPDAAAGDDGVDSLGALPRPALHRHLAGALALFHAQDFPETFGLVFAESMALGTPVLAPPVAAAPEVIGDPRQCAPIDPVDALAARIEAWRAGGRPRPAANPDFALPAVLSRWQAALDAPISGDAPADDQPKILAATSATRRPW